MQLATIGYEGATLAQVLDTMRPYATGKLICVFGCGGDRDRGKRPLMGTIAAEKADVVIVTDDNPRSEEPASIRAAIMAAAPGAAFLAHAIRRLRVWNRWMFIKYIQARTRGGGGWVGG